MTQVSKIAYSSIPSLLQAGAAEAIAFLTQLEEINRNKVKRVILDCPAEMAQEILVRHVQSIHLGRRNFHYLMSSLVMDDHWDPR